MKVVAFFAVVVAVLLAIVGWIMNIVAIFGTDFTPITGIAVLRVIGVFVAPIGGILGWI